MELRKGLFMAKQNTSSNISVISSKHNAENWVALQDELPVPFMEVLFYSEITDICRVGYWDPLEEKVAISTIKMERDNDECISLCNAIAEMNPSFRSATHWKYLPLQPFSSDSPKKTINQIIKNQTIDDNNDLDKDEIDENWADANEFNPID